MRCLYLSGLFFTVIGFLFCAGLPEKCSPLYSPSLTESQIGVLVKDKEVVMATFKAIFIKHNTLEIQEKMGYETS